MGSRVGDKNAKILLYIFVGGITIFGHKVALRLIQGILLLFGSALEALVSFSEETQTFFFIKGTPKRGIRKYYYLL
ncbi:hypothetical protein GDO81_012244 [Engystomops pustulosus]|uniref:Uncharacterized protein n=1 Tax=Engystomops pustulosus TaxID=76066 RepID=A0AAV7BKQ3_ENGPU|nr:hypothetical protein GDO81_012244 [Engystomops pustulosus]